MPDTDYAPPAVKRSAAKRARQEPASTEVPAPADAEAAPPAAKRPGAKKGAKYLAGAQKVEILRRCDALGAAALAHPLSTDDCDAWAAALRAALPEDESGSKLRAACTSAAVQRLVNNYRKAQGWSSSAAAAPATAPGAPPKRRKVKAGVSDAEKAVAKTAREATQAAAAPPAGSPAARPALQGLQLQ
jgi:hypothetical protein